MKVKELIGKLEDILKKEGDIPVRLGCNWEEVWGDIENISVNEDNEGKEIFITF